MPEMDLVMVKRDGGLFPADMLSIERFEKMKTGAEALVHAKTPRNVRHHRLAWVLAEELANCCDFLFDREDAMEYLKLKSRHVDWLTDHQTGKVYPRTRSIAFASLSQEKFDTIFNRFVWVACNVIVPDLEEQALRDRIHQIVDGEPQRRAA